MMEAMQQIPIFLVGVSVVQILGWRPFNVYFLNERVETYHPEIMNLNFTIRNARNASFLDLKLDILRELPQFFIDFEDLHDSGNGTYDLVFMNRTVNLCSFLSNRKVNPIIAVIYQMYANVVQMPKGCPLLKKRYEVQNVFVDPNKFPPFMPDHKAKILSNMWSRQNGRYGKKVYLLKLSLEVVFERSFKRPADH